MKILITYFTQTGNTEKVARSMSVGGNGKKCCCPSGRVGFGRRTALCKKGNRNSYMIPFPEMALELSKR